MSTEEKFHAAVNVIRSLPKNGSYQPSNELMLRFYAFFKQATLGPCKGSRPAFWDVVGRAKYDAWKKLDDMGKQEAMSNYVAELHRIVETMSYNDNVANFLEAQTELESVPLGDLELVAGDVIERVRSQPNSPFASREASPQRLRSSLETTPASSQCSPSTSPPPQDESDDEYIDTIDDFATKKTIPNGYISENIPNGHGPQTSHSRSSRSKTKTTPGFQPITPTAAAITTVAAAAAADKTNSLRVDISQEVLKTIQCLKSDIERLTSKVSHLEKSATKTAVVKRGTRFAFKHLSPSLLAFIVLWPIVTHSLLRYWSKNNRK